jgi:hypothetical protein
VGDDAKVSAAEEEAQKQVPPPAAGTITESGMLRVDRVKIFSDGSLGAETAALLQPYVKTTAEGGGTVSQQGQERHGQTRTEGTEGATCMEGMPPGQEGKEGTGDADKTSFSSSTTASATAPENDGKNRGLLIHTQRRLNAMVCEATCQGYRLEVHAIGDRAAESVMEAFEACPGFGPAQRPLLTHAQVLTGPLVERMARLGVVANVQPSFVKTDAQWVRKRIHPSSWPFAYCWKTLLERGVVVAGGSDAPVEHCSPLRGIHDAMSRDEFRPEEALTFAEALAIYTLNGAYAAGLEARQGAIAVGMDADFVVLGCTSGNGGGWGGSTDGNEKWGEGTEGVNDAESSSEGKQQEQQQQEQEQQQQQQQPWSDGRPDDERPEGGDRIYLQGRLSRLGTELLPFPLRQLSDFYDPGMVRRVVVAGKDRYVRNTSSGHGGHGGHGGGEGGGKGGGAAGAGAVASPMYAPGRNGPVHVCPCCRK